MARRNKRNRIRHVKLLYMTTRAQIATEITYCVFPLYQLPLEKYNIHIHKPYSSHLTCSYFHVNMCAGYGTFDKAVFHDSGRQLSVELF
jgi:hypothetical protein